MGRPVKFKNFDEESLAKDLARLFEGFENSIKFKQKVGALELRKARELKLGRIDEFNFEFNKRKLQKIKKLF